MRVVSLVCLAVLGTAACKDSAGLSSHQVRVSFSSVSAAPAAAATVAQQRVVGSPMTISDAKGTLVIARAQIVLGEIELKRTSAAECPNHSGSGDDDCAEIEAGPVLVDLPVNGGFSAAVAVGVPAGRYRELEMEIEDADDERAAGVAFLNANPAFRDVSIRVEGTYNGQPFVFTSALEAEREIEFATPLVVGSDGLDITINVDVSSWFRTPGGALLDPVTANVGGPNADLVTRNIIDSFDAFEDDDHDGRRDDHGSDDT